MSETVDEMTAIREAAIAAVGTDAQPTTYIRTAITPISARIQQLWMGEFGTIWLDVPNFEVGVLPPRLGQP